VKKREKIEEQLQNFIENKKGMIARMDSESCSKDIKRE
jgi:hypothetical protein